MPRRVSLALVVLLFLGAHSVGFAQTLRQILNSGPRSNRFNIVIVSEGYTSAELTTKFPGDAQRLLNAVFQAQPYHEYKSLFNAFTIAVASAQSGSDHPAQNLFRNTYFNSTYDTNGIDRLLTIPPNDYDANYDNGRGKVFALLASLLPDYDVVFMLVNDPAYGGSGGSLAITSLDPSASEILIHEAGHTLGGLGDEYDSAGGFPFEAPNTTQQVNRPSIIWHTWISPNTPIPTPETPAFASVIGLFQGAAYNTVGWYRPKLACKMKDLNVPFCAVCQEALVLNFEQPLSLIDRFSPTGSTVFRKGSQIDFSVTKLRPLTHSLATQWYFDGVPVSGATNDTFTLLSASLGSARHTVTVQVRDISAFVRNDPGRIQWDNNRWSIVGPPGTFDFDGDGKTDLSVFHGNVWSVFQSSNNSVNAVAFGASTDKIAPADYDGDGRTDIAVFRSSNGTWYYIKSSNSQHVAIQFGGVGDLPRPGDFDGDGKADLGIFRPSNGTWYFINSSNGQHNAVRFGGNGDFPLMGDFDGDGRSDLAIFRPSTGFWYHRRSRDGQTRSVHFGAGSDIPVPGDYDGDGLTDVAIFRPTTGIWYQINSSTGASFTMQWGANGDKPVPGDYDHDGKTDRAFFRGATWYVQLSTNGSSMVRNFGVGTDIHVPAAYLP